ncbi:MAG: hypothetical protein U0792_12735 [Gemmataceae bacterium]
MTATQCWKGDCCCFTLEEKLVWADAQGIQPPAHVRPMVEARRVSVQPKKACCSHSEPEPQAKPPHSCCDKKAAKSCCTATKTETPKVKPACSHCEAQTSSESHEAKDSPKGPSRTQWVAGVYAHKCRGDGSVALFELDPAVVTDLNPVLIDAPERAQHGVPRSERATSTPRLPPTPPPRAF